MRKFLSNFMFIHALVLVGMFAVLGYALTDNKFILLGVTASFGGAICGSFIKVIDEIKDSKK